MAASQGQWVMTHQAPDFIIVGAQKAGTTSLYNCLKQHPEIVPASKKEIQYFSQFYNKGYDWYLQHFKLRDDNLQSGEASPFYLFHPHAAARIAQALPEVRIIVLLRNPVQRAISHYHQQARCGHEKLTMFEAFINEERRIAKPWQKLLNNEQVSGVKIQQCSYLKRGLYLEQLLRYEAHFPPAQIHLVDSDVFSPIPWAPCKPCTGSWVSGKTSRRQTNGHANRETIAIQIPPSWTGCNIILQHPMKHSSSI